MIEYRATAANVAFDGQSGIFEGRAVAFDVTDQYGTQFTRGTFTDGLRAGIMPSITLGHDWRSVVGIVTDWKELGDGLHVVAQLDDPGAVPDAAKAWTQMRSGSVRELSVGFTRLAEEPHPTLPGVTVITKAQLDEVACVLRGAVPGSKVLATRSAHTATPMSPAGLDAVSLARRVVAGELTYAEARAAMTLARAPRPRRQPPTTPLDREIDDMLRVIDERFRL